MPLLPLPPNKKQKDKERGGEGTQKKSRKKEFILHLESKG